MEPHEILGVEPDASPEEIRKAYLELARRHHSDKGGNDRRMAEINEAHSELMKNQKNGKDLAPLKVPESLQPEVYGKPKMDEHDTRDFTSVVMTLADYREDLTKVSEASVNRYAKKRDWLDILGLLGGAITALGLLTVNAYLSVFLAAIFSFGVLYLAVTKFSAWWDRRGNFNTEATIESLVKKRTPKN